MVFDTPGIQILALYLDLEGAKNIHVLKVLILGFRGHWMLLTGVWHLHLNLDMVTGLNGLKVGSVSLFCRCKEHLCHLRSYLEIWRTLDVPYWVQHLDLDLNMVNGVDTPILLILALDLDFECA